MLNKIGENGCRVLRVIIAMTAVFIFFIGMYIFCDMYRTEMSAFEAHEFTEMKPGIEKDGKPDFTELHKKNKDIVGWITISGTQIDYPILHGKDDMEYLNKDPYGIPNVSGSIYLATRNRKEMDERYMLLYGHHISSGIMFGDLDKFNDKSFFRNKDRSRFKEYEGTLITSGGKYNLRIFACLNTDAYDKDIYQIDTSDAHITKLIQHIKDKSRYYTGIEDAKDKRILALSTCGDYKTNARIVIFCEILEHKGDEKQPEPAIALPMEGLRKVSSYWAFLNLISMILCVYVAIPIHIMIGKIIEKARKRKGRKKGRQRSSTEVVLNIFAVLTGVISIIAFYIFEDMHMPIEMTDRHTPLFILLCVIVVIVRHYADKAKRKREKLENRKDDWTQYRSDENTGEGIDRS